MSAALPTAAALRVEASAWWESRSSSTQRGIVVGGALSAVGALLACWWYQSQRREQSRKGRLRRSTAASSPTPRRSLTRADSLSHTRHPSFTPHPPTPGNDSAPLYPYETHALAPLDTSTPSSLSSSQSSPSSSTSPSPSRLAVVALPSTPPASVHHQRSVSVSNEEPREQLFYDLLSITAAVPNASHSSSALKSVTEESPPRRSLPPSPLPPPLAMSASSTAPSSSSSSPAHSSPASALSPGGGAVDLPRLRALQHKWAREQRHKENRARRHARSQLDAVSTASPFSAASSATSIDSPLDGLDDSTVLPLNHTFGDGEPEEVKEPLTHAQHAAVHLRRRGRRAERSPVVKRLNGLFAEQATEESRRKKEEDEVKR